MNEFTARHFELLGRWKEHRLDRSDPEQNQAYEELRDAYSVTGAWAHAVRERLFPSGSVKIIKKPTNQAQKVAVHHWAQILPEEHSPSFLAYTVGISAVFGFEIKIDTVRLSERDRHTPCGRSPGGREIPLPHRTHTRSRIWAKPDGTAQPEAAGDLAAL